MAGRSKKARARTHRLGVMAEYAAMLWLTFKGYRLVVMRYKTPVGEIDLVMRRGRTLAIIEVKARKMRGDAAHAITRENQSRVIRASQVFLIHHPAYADYQVRFDALVIAWYSWPRHLPHAFTNLT